jgi:hypothetical protein
MLVSTLDIFAVTIALGISLALITSTTVRNAQLYKDNTNLRRTIRIQNMAKQIKEDTYNPWEINPDHDYESQHGAK